MAINFRRAVYKYASNEQIVAYNAMADTYQSGVPSLSQQYYYGPLDELNNIFPDDITALAYYDAYLPGLAVAEYNLAFGATETVGIVAEFNADTVLVEFARVDGELAAALVRISDLEDTVLSLEARVSALEV